MVAFIFGLTFCLTSVINMYQKKRNKMRFKHLVLGSFLAFFLLIYTSLGQANQLVVSQIQGEGVEILKKGKAHWVKASGGQALAIGDTIRTNKKARATLLSQEGHKILIKQETVFQISKLGPVEYEFIEESGRARLKVSKLGAGQSLNVKTPSAVCSVRGTEFEVIYEDRRTICDVYEGFVGFTDAQRSAPEVNILENQRSVIEQQGAPPKTPEGIPENERIREPGFSQNPRGPGQPGMAGPMPGGPVDEKMNKDMRALDDKFRQLDPNDKEGLEKLEKERMALMKDGFDQFMKDFKGSPEDKARMEKEFKEHTENVNQNGMGNDTARGFGPMGGGFYGPPMDGMPGTEMDPNNNLAIETKGEMISRMQDDFGQFMKDFNGSPEEREKFEKVFREEMDRFQTEDFGPGHGREGYGNNEPMGGPYADGRDYRNPPEGEKEGERNFWGNRGDDEFRQEIHDEINHDYRQDQYQESIKDELRLELVQTSKELIDRNGRRVRLEENVVRPTPDSFKFISLSKREDREDSVVFEVFANRPLPDNLEEAGNLWFHSEPTKPLWYAVKQRLTITNGVDENSGTDRIVQLFLDGDSKEVLSSNSFYQDGKYITSTRGFQTMFDHRYELINGDRASAERMWIDSGFRPSNLSGMMWHMRPVLIEVYNPSQNNVASSFWEYTFVTTSGAGNTATGKMMVTQFVPGSGPTIAHFIQNNSYINFVDSNGNGRIDRGESYEDFDKDGQRDNDEPYQNVSQFGLSGAKEGVGDFTFNGEGDNTFFSDLNRDNINNDNLSSSDPFRVATQPWAFKKEEMLLIDDFGKIVDFTEYGFGSRDQLNSQENLADLFEKLNMERVITSSEFGNRDIDVIMTPRMFMKAKMIEVRMEGNEEIDSRR